MVLPYTNLSSQLTRVHYFFPILDNYNNWLKETGTANKMLRRSEVCSDAGQLTSVPHLKLDDDNDIMTIASLHQSMLFLLPQRNLHAT
jgi:hypothetical protein